MSSGVSSLLVKQQQQVDSPNVGAGVIPTAKKQQRRPLSMQDASTSVNCTSKPSNSRSSMESAIDWPMPVLPPPNEFVRTGVAQGGPPPSPGDRRVNLNVIIPSSGEPTPPLLAASRMAVPQAPPMSPSAAAVRAIKLQSPAFARPRNSPTPGPRLSSQQQQQQQQGNHKSSSEPRPRSDSDSQVSFRVLQSSDLPDGWDELEEDRSPAGSNSTDQLWPISPWGRRGSEYQASDPRSGHSEASSELGPPHPHSPKGPPSGGKSQLSHSISFPLSMGQGVSLPRSSYNGSNKPPAPSLSGVGSRSASSNPSSTALRPGAPTTKYRHAESTGI